MKGSDTPGLSLVAGGLLVAGVVWLGAGGAAGCSRSSEASPARERPEEAAAPVVAAGAKVDNPNYNVTFRAEGPYQQGKEGSAEVVVEAKGEYHINDQYPFRFTPKDGDGATFKGPVGREGSTVEKAKVVLKVPFTPTRAGDVKLAGKISLSVCSDKQCLMEKQDLEVTASVK
ncbi:MAG: hypothetical protein MUF34_06625 [Polyangiaceae bacterium]|jgi:hypothetical protein|nr:hypothetical protein [Polyangiaceae bacterium]